ncbi:MAG: hypothetical protein K2G03_05860, partial [Bacilli bacterium]|nr:hypothetical protein [Bacilli bacterium]
LYTKLIRIHVNNKIFDVFADQSHRKEFLEVKKKEEYEEYYYPMLKDYWFLNGIYNKPFDGILYSHKYAFKRGVFVGLLGFGGLVALYSTFQGTTPYKLQTNNPNIEVTTEIEDPTEYEKEINENYYTKIITQIEKLDEYGIHKVTIEDLRNSLSQNLSIDPKYRAYIEEFIDCLEKKLPNADYRVFNDNLQRYVINNHFVSDRVEGNFDVYNGIINAKEKYIDKEGNEDQKTEKRVVVHELTHGLNHGLIISENERIYYSFSPSQFGDGFDEAYTTILADYLLSDDYKEYFSEVTRQYDSYGKTSETCYQTLKILEDSYTFEDYINNDIFYLEEKLQQHGLDDAVDIMDTYHLSIYEDESITIDEECEYSDLKGNIYKKGIEKSLE